MISSLAEMLLKQTGLDEKQIMLMRHFSDVDRLEELGGNVEEFTFIQPKDSGWDFWQHGKPRIRISRSCARRCLRGLRDH